MRHHETVEEVEEVEDYLPEEGEERTETTEGQTPEIETSQHQTPQGSGMTTAMDSGSTVRTTAEGQRIPIRMVTTTARTKTAIQGTISTAQTTDTGETTNTRAIKGAINIRKGGTDGKSRTN